MLNSKKVLNISAQSRRNQRVSKRRVFLAIFLLALWLPATSHALLEDFGFIHQDVADASGHDGADGLCLTPSGDAQLGKHFQDDTSLSLHLLPSTLNSPVDILPPPRLELGAPGPAPPLLRKSWQFMLRAALPVRSPSLAF